MWRTGPRRQFTQCGIIWAKVEPDFALVMVKNFNLPFRKSLGKNAIFTKVNGKAFRLLLFLFFLLIFLFRLSLIYRGAYAWPDENRYLSSLDAANQLFAGKFLEAFAAISNTQGRPGDALLRLFPAFIQIGAERWFHLPASDLASLLIPQLFNVAISLLIVLVFYKIVRQLFREQPPYLALICTAVYSLLTNNNIYIRHILPYDTSLLIFLVALYLALKITNRDLKEPADTLKKVKPANPRLFILCGGLVGLGFTVYPGYYFFPVIIFVMLVFGSKPFLTRLKILNIFSAGIAVILVLMVFEVIAHFGGTSYIASSLLLSDTINQGTFEEGFIFLPEYLAQVDTFSGVLLLTLALFFLARTLYWLVRYRKLSRLEVLGLVASGGYLLHASASVFLHKMVFYGRLLHLYIPFMVLAAFGALLLLNKKWQGYILAIVLLFSIISFVQFSFEYLPLAYSESVLQNQGINLASYGVIDAQNETGPCHQEDPVLPARGVGNTKITLVNFCFFYPITATYTPYKADAPQKSLYNQPHFLSFRAYTFEAFSASERELIHNRQYRIQIYVSEA